MINRVSKRIGLVMAIGMTLSVAGCNSSNTPQNAESPTASTALHTKANTKQLMTWILEPPADVVWAAVGSVTTEKGEEKLAPKTEEAWNNVRNAAATVAEAGNLLLVAPHAHAGDDWKAMVTKMIDSANQCVEAAEAKDVETLFTAGGDLYLACTACHTKYVINATADKK